MMLLSYLAFDVHLIWLCIRVWLPNIIHWYCYCLSPFVFWKCS